MWFVRMPAKYCVHCVVECVLSLRLDYAPYCLSLLITQKFSQSSHKGNFYLPLLQYSLSPVEIAVHVTLVARAIFTFIS